MPRIYTPAYLTTDILRCCWEFEEAPRHRDTMGGSQPQAQQVRKRTFPSLPALPVRPIRCIYTAVERGRSKLMTRATPLKSTPRASKSVQIKNHICSLTQ